MRWLFLVAALALAVLRASPALASCAPPASIGENAQRATAVLYGTVTASGNGALTLRIDRVLKGQATGTVRIFVGPARGGASSVDYPDLSRPAAVGSDHILYVTHGADGQLETNACVGSHPGPPTADEVAYFGITGSSAPATPGAATAPEPLLPASMSGALWTVVIGLAALGTAAFLLLRRRLV